ncbi:hypothetical protein MTO96_046320 [Rhipicephalus appendiculatus]
MPAPVPRKPVTERDTKEEKEHEVERIKDETSDKEVDGCINGSTEQKTTTIQWGRSRSRLPRASVITSEEAGTVSEYCQRDGVERGRQRTRAVPSWWPALLGVVGDRDSNHAQAELQTGTAAGQDYRGAVVSHATYYM